MATMYILAADDLDDADIIAVYSSYELAKEAQRLWDDSQIEPVDVDTIPCHPPGTVGWHVTLRKKEGAVFVHRAKKFNPLWVDANGGGHEYSIANGAQDFYISCWAASKDEAIEIAKRKYDDFQAKKMVP